jgi:hypothetical protein
MKNQTLMNKGLSIMMIMLGFLVVQNSWSQTYFDMSASNYSQTFTAWSGYPTEWNGNAINATGVIPSATRLTAATTTLAVSGTGAGAGYDAASSTKLILLATGATDNTSAVAADLNLNMSMRNAGNLTFDAATVFNGTGDRISNLRVYYTINNSTWTEITGTNLPYSAKNNVAGSASISVSLPSAISNQAQVKLRFYCHNSGGTGSTTGSRPKISIDNVAVTSTMQVAPSVFYSQSLTNFSTTQGTPSAAQTFTVSGSDLWTFVTVSAPAGYEISLSPSSGYTSSLNLNPTGSTLPSTTIYIRLTGASIGQFIGTVDMTSTGSGNPQFVTPDGQVVAAAGIDQTISFGVLPGVTYGDLPLSLNATATSGLAVTYSSSNTSVVTVSGTTLTIVGVGSASITASQSGDATYNPAPDVVRGIIVSPKSLTVSNAAASDKVFNNSSAAVITGTLSGVVGSDDVALNGAGTFADLNVANGIAVTAACTLTGTTAGNYTLIQPTGLTANITAANATITFNAIPTYSTANTTFTLNATASSGAAVSYTSSNTSVATVAGNVVTIVAAGTSVITASAAATTNYNAPSDATQTLTVTSALMAFDFFGMNNVATANPTYVLPGMLPAASQPMTRGAGAASSSAANSFRTVGFQNNGIATTNTDYFQFTVTANPGLGLNFTSIDARYAGTASFYGTSPGVSAQYAYSLDGTNYTLISTPATFYSASAVTSFTQPQIDLSGISALQNIQPGTTVSFRYYASGQTTTGGWGFISTAAGLHGLVIGGSTFAVPCAFYADADGDGYGNPSVTQNATCGSTVTGYVELNNSDCNDNAAGVHPGATELACNTIDDNCNGTVDENFVTGCNDPLACNYSAAATCATGCDYTAQTFYLDADNDSYGTNSTTETGCTPSAGYVLTGGDCNDNNVAVNPGVAEILCNSIDDNCNSTIDEGSVSGCMDPNATNYNASANCSATCNYTNFTAGNILVMKLGTGAAALSAAGTPVFVEERSASALVQTLSLPTTGANRMVVHGSSTAEAQMSRAQDGTAVYFAGYDAAVGTASINTTTSAVAPRVISSMGMNAGTFARQASSATLLSTYNFRSATGNGSNFWGVGSNGGVNYFGTGAATQVSSTVTNIRVTSVQNGQLYFTTGSGTAGVYAVGTGMPTATGTTSTMVFATGAGSSPYAFQFSADGNTCYVADDRTTAAGGIQKWTKTGGVWSLAYTISVGAATGARGIAVDFYAGAQPRIYAVINNAAGTGVVYLDENGTATPTVNTLATATTASNTAYRSLAFAPCTSTTWYADADGDGYGNASATLSYCTQPYGYVANATDCDDSNIAVNPSGTEVCGGTDENCDGQFNEGLTFYNYYQDLDGDGYGSTILIGNNCFLPSFAGYPGNSDDCDDNNAAANPAGTDICNNGIDEDCSGADCVSGLGAAVNMNNIAQFGTGSQATYTVDLASGTNTIESPGTGLDKWFKFTATNNAVRIALTGSTAVADDNDISLYNEPTTTGTQLIPIAAENDVHVGNQGVAADAGSEILYFDGLVAGNVYYVCVRNNNSAAGTVSLVVSYLKASATDILPYTNYTGVYSNTCQNFKAAFRTGTTQYVVNRWTSSDISGTPVWSYAIPSGTICQLGRIVPANLGTSNQTIYVTVNCTYNLTDAFGNALTITASASAANAFQLAPETDLNVRTTDRCPVYKSATSGSVATNRSVCGTNRYEWSFAQTLPTPSLPIEVLGAVGGSRILGMSAILGIGAGQTYDVQIRSKHFDGVSNTNYGTTQCVRTLGTAGMPTVEDGGVIAERSENGVTTSIYPNPNNGQSVNFAVSGMEGDLNVRIVDATGRMVFANRYVVEGSLNTTIDFGQTLAGGVYMVEMIQNGEMKTMRMVVSK